MSQNQRLTQKLSSTVGVVLIGAWTLVELLVATGCSRKSAEPTDTTVAAGSERQKELFAAELARDVTKILPADLANRDVLTRRAAVRAIARSDAFVARPMLERALADEDPEVISWAAFGLGRVCAGNTAAQTIQKIIARAASLMQKTAPGSASLSSARLDPWFAFAEAIGRCRVPESERILRSWLTVGNDLAKSAVLGLDYYAQSTKSLEAPTIVALLEAAEKERDLTVALLAISRLTTLDPLAGRRLVAMAPRLLEAAGDGRRYLLRALPLAGQPALTILERVAIDDGHYHPLERVEAIRAIGQLDATGQESLARILPRIAGFDALTTEAFLLSSKWSIFSELFQQLKEVPKPARAELGRFLLLDASAVKSPASLRRISHLRCRVACLLFADDPFAPAIERCAAAANQREKKLAQLAVLDRLRISGKNTNLLETLLGDPDPPIAMAALNLLATHDEVASAADWLLKGLRSESMGIVTTASRILADHPQHSKRGGSLQTELATSLERALSRTWPADAVEVRVALMDAIGQLGFLSAKAPILAECGSPIPRLRQHAVQALHRLGEPNHDCPRAHPSALPRELDHIVTQPMTLRFATDVGPLEIRLDPTLAPVTVTRVLDLAKSHFYDGIEVHRVVPGFVAQLGDRSADGFGGAGQAPIPCELSPEAFGPLDVGMALSGLDSGSSQFFVSLGPYPQLGSDYSRLGRASAGWEQLFVGDRIEKVELVP